MACQISRKTFLFLLFFAFCAVVFIPGFVFAQTYTLGIYDNPGTGSGEIRDDYTGGSQISCSLFPTPTPNGDDCTEEYTSWSQPSFTAYPYGGVTFNGWTGCDSVSGTGGVTCNLTNMNTNRMIQARFDLTSDLVSHWKFDEASGITAEDSSTFNYTGTLMNNTTRVGGVSGNALSFDGVGDYVSLPVLSVLNGTPALTVCGWVNLNTLGTTADVDDAAIFTMAGTSNEYILLWYNVNANGTGDHLYSFNVGSTALTERVNSVTSATANTWQHVCGVMEGANRRIYVDGSLNNSHSSAVGTTFIGGTSQARIGSWSSTANFDMNGFLDDVRIYNYALTSTEVQNLYNANLKSLTVTKTGNSSGFGTISSSPSGLSCTGSVTPCTTSFVNNTAVVLTASPVAGYNVSWTGCDSSSGNTCNVTMSAAKSVTANFVLGSVTGPIGHWKFDEASGITAEDSSTFNYTGTLMNNTTRVGGVSGNALSFDGVGDYVSLPVLSVLNGTPALTVCGWVNLNTLGTTADVDDAAIFTMAGTSNEYILLWYNVNANGTGDHLYSFNVGSTALTERVNSVTSATANTWQHVCGVMEGANRRIYVDGSLNNSHSSAVGTTFIGGTSQARIGSWSSTANFDMNGSLDDVRIYNRALSAGEISALADAGGEEMNGYAWSSTIGWISLNCATGGLNQSDVCTASDYKVAMDNASGKLSGYAWSPNVGWIFFDPSLASCPSGSCPPTVNKTTGAVTGWARALSGCQEIAGTPATSCSSLGAGAVTGGWDGWIELSGLHHTSPDMSGDGGTTYISDFLRGFAWGSDVIGWLKFNPTELGGSIDLEGWDEATLDFTAPVSIPAGSPLSLQWTASNLSYCEADNDAGDVVWVGEKDSSSGTHSETTNPLLTPGTFHFTLNCQDLDSQWVPPDPSATLSVSVTCDNYSTTPPKISVNPCKDNQSSCIETKILEAPSTFPAIEKFNVYESVPDGSGGWEQGVYKAFAAAGDLPVSATEPELVPNVDYCRMVRSSHDICGLSLPSATQCTYLPDTPINWSIDSVSCGDAVSGSGTSANPYVASGTIEIPDGTGFVAFNTTNTAGSGVKCKVVDFSSSDDLTPAGVNSGSENITLSGDTTVTFQCSDSFGSSRKEKAVCATSKRCLIENDCLNCYFEPPNSPMAPVVGKMVTFTADIQGGTAPYTIVWSGDGINFTKAGVNDGPQQLIHVYSVTGQKSVTATVTDSDSHTATCSSVMRPDVGIKGTYKEL